MIVLKFILKLAVVSTLLYTITLAVIKLFDWIVIGRKKK